MVSVNIDVEKCTGCGTCVDVCPVAVFELQETGGKTTSVAVAEDECIVCRACEAQCPEEAIEVVE
jgi:NAD-dependent dihydropyrimidine dehydrogenase PreA subunit